MPGSTANRHAVAHGGQQDLVLATRLGKPYGMLGTKRVIGSYHQRKPAVQAHHGTKLHLLGLLGLCAKVVKCSPLSRIDRQAIIDSVLLGQGMAAYGPLQRNIHNDPDVAHYDYDPEKAKTILEDAGCTMSENGFYERNGKEIGFVISVMAGEQDRIDIAQAAAQQLRDIGINCTVDIPAQMDWGGQMACLIGWGSPFDADDHTYKVFGTDKGANYSGYSNALVDEYLTLARQSSDDAVRKEYYSKFLHALADDPAYAFICYIDANYVAKSTIHGIDADTVLGHHGVGIFWNIQDWTIGE